MNADAAAMATRPGAPARVAIVRSPGAASRFVAADTVNQLRHAGVMAVELDAASLDVDDTAITGRVEAAAYDLVVQVGLHVPSALRLATALSIPLARLDAPLPEPTHLLHQGKRALSQEALLDLRLDGRQLLTAMPARLRIPNSRHAPVDVYEVGAASARQISLADGLIDVTDLPHSEVVVAGDAERFRAARLEVASPEPIELLVDGWPYHPHAVTAQAHPTGVRVVDWRAA